MSARLVVIAAVLAAAPAAADGEPGELSLVPGPEGFVATWLVLGPTAAPRARRSDLDQLAAWDPLSTAEVGAAPVAGERGPGGRWRAVTSRQARLQLEARTRGTVTYLAAVLRTSAPRRVWLSVGSDGGLAVALNGRQLHRAAPDRAVARDTDLVALELPAGDSLLLLRLWTLRSGRVRVFARFSDEQHRRLRDLEIVLPGAAGQRDRVLQRSASVGFERRIDLDAGALVARVWLEFPAGRPLEGPGEARISFEGPESPEPIRLALETGSDGPAAELLADLRFEGRRCPNAARVALGKAALSARLGVRMRDVAQLKEAADALERARALEGLPRTSVESVEWRVEHLRELLEDGDQDYRYLGRELRITAAMARDLAAGRDPFADARGEIQRRGYRSAVDGELHHYALYVPPGWREKGEARFGLVVALHGLNGLPIKTLQSLFGIPLDEGESKLLRARHPRPVAPAPMFAVAPEGFGNSGYHQFGERDVLEVIGRVTERYRIDPLRIYVTGASMGGIGAGALPLHNPDLFAAAAPLCGYHSLANYSSLRGVRFRPWEEFLASFRSNADWAENGRHVPLLVVHGTRDNPRHSASLVERYQLLGYDVTYETPEAGHNVWDETYRDRRIFTHFKRYWRRPHPRRVTLRTARLRYRSAYWLRIDDVTDHGAWAGIDGTWNRDGRVEIETENVAAFTVRRDDELAGDRDPAFAIDEQPVMAGTDTDGAFRFHRVDGVWVSGAPEPCRGLCKRPGLAGPMDDAFYEPLLFVYGTADPDETALARRVIERIRSPGSGVTVDWPVEADVEVSERDIAEHSLVIVGTPAGNGLLARIADRLPLRVEGGAVVAGRRRFSGDRVAASFVFPNPLNPERYVLVHTAVSPRGLYYTGHLPTLLPDWVVYDGSSWGRLGGMVLGERQILAGGLFDSRWRIAE